MMQLCNFYTRLLWKDVNIQRDIPSSRVQDWRHSSLKQTAKLRIQVMPAVFNSCSPKHTVQGCKGIKEYFMEALRSHSLSWCNNLIIPFMVCYDLILLLCLINMYHFVWIMNWCWCCYRATGCNSLQSLKSPNVLACRYKAYKHLL